MSLSLCTHWRNKIYLVINFIFSILENKLISYADNSTLMAVVPSPGVRVVVTLAGLVNGVTFGGRN